VITTTQPLLATSTVIVGRLTWVRGVKKKV